MSWKANQQQVEVYRFLKVDKENYEEKLVHEDKPDDKLKRLTIEQLNNDNIAIKKYGLEANKKIRIKLSKQDVLNVNDLIYWNGFKYIVDTETNTYRLHKTVDATVYED